MATIKLKYIEGLDAHVIHLIETYMSNPEIEYPRVVQTVSAAGDTILHTPALGKCILVRRIKCTPDPDTADAPMLTLRVGPKLIQTGPVLYGSDFVKGAVDDSLILNLQSSASIGVTILYEEVDP